MNELVQRLSSGNHAVELMLRQRTVAELKQHIDRGHLHIKFAGTRGGTELGVQVDKRACDFSGLDSEQGSGRAKLVGNLRLNFVDVRCVADIDVNTFEGSGYLEVIDGIT